MPPLFDGYRTNSLSQIGGRLLNSYVANFRLTMSPNYQFGITDITTMARRGFSAAADAVPQLLLVEA